MKTFRVEVSDTEVIHVYSNDESILLQLRKNVPTDVDPGTPSFKAALSIKPGHAQEPGLELMNVAQRIYKKRRADQEAEKKKKQAGKVVTSGSNVVPLKAAKV